MKTFKLFFPGALLLFACLFLFSACDDDDNDGDNGNVRFEITDAPVDDPNVEGVYVTITGLEVNGQAIADFEGPLTINLMDYRDGEVKRLGFADLDAGTYNDVTLMLDYDADQNGNAPGIYVQTTDGTKHALATTNNTDAEIEVNGSFTVDENDSQENVIIDFDLRKAVIYSQSGSDPDYSLVTDAELDEVTRLVTEENTGTIEGDFDGDLTQAGDVIIVYAYRSGTYTNSERQGQGTSNIPFKNAVTSAVIDGNEEFILPYLPQGTYELYFVGYEDSNNDGRMEMKGALSLDVLGDINPNNVTVKAKETVNLNLEITGIIPF